MAAFKLLVVSMIALAVSGACAHRSLKAAPSVESIDMGSYTLHRVDWTVGLEYEDILAQCGDQVEFVWDGNLHNVGVAEDGECELIRDATEPVTSGKVTYTLDNTLEDVAKYGEVYFACSVGRHCDKGQKLEFYVDCSNTNATMAG